MIPMTDDEQDRLAEMVSIILLKELMKQPVDDILFADLFLFEEEGKVLVSELLESLQRTPEVNKEFFTEYILLSISFTRVSHVWWQKEVLKREEMKKVARNKFSGLFLDLFSILKGFAKMWSQKEITSKDVFQEINETITKNLAQGCR